MINQYLLGHRMEVTDGQRIWYIADLSGFLMEIDLSSKELKAIWKISDSRNPCAYRSLFYDNHKLYIFPYYQRTIYIYDLSTSSYEEIEVAEGLALTGGIKRGRFLYAFGQQSKILKCNLENYAITYIDVQSELNDLKEFSSSWFWIRAFVLDGCIHIPILNTNIMVVLDQYDHVSRIYLGERAEKWMLVNIYVDSGRYSTIYCKGEENHFTTYIAKYGFNGKLIQESVVEEKYPYQTYPFVNAIWNKSKWICLPFGRNEILLRDGKHDKLLFEIDKGINFTSSTIEGLFYCSVWINEDTLCSMNQSTGSLICINRNDLTVSSFDLELKENPMDLMEKSYLDALKFHYSLPEIKGLNDLQCYIDYICNSEIQQIKDCTRAGEIIYAKVKP